MMHRVQSTFPTRFGTSAGLLKNSAAILKDCLKGQVENIGELKDGAFILSAVLQSSGRIYTVAQSAKKTRNTPEGPYRYIEGIKTFFREVLGLTLNFFVLRTFQRVMVDVLRHYFGVRAPLGKAPIKMLQSTWHKLFNTSGTKLVTQTLDRQPYPGIFKTLQNLGEQIVSGGKVLYTPAKYNPQVTKDLLKHPGIEYDQLLNRGNYDKWEKPINWLNKQVGWLTGKDLTNVSKGKKLETVFEWLPVAVGSIPSILFAGFWLEWFTQNKSEKVAKGLYSKLNKPTEPAKAVASPPALPPAPVAHPQPLVSWPQLSYAVNPWVQQFANWSPQGVFTAFHSPNPFNHPSA